MPKPKSTPKDDPKSETPKAETPKVGSTGGNFQDQLESWADKAVAPIKYARLKLWKDVFFHPTKTLAEETGAGGLRRAAKDVFVSSLPRLLVGLVALLLVMLYFFMIGMFTIAVVPVVGIIALPTLIIGAVVLLVLYFLSPIISWFLIAVVQFVIAKILGGKADFRSQSYLLGLAMSAVNAVDSGMTVLNIVLLIIPCLGWMLAAIIRPLLVLIGFYGYYLNFRAVKTAHGLDDVRAAVVVILPVLLGMLLIVLLVVGFYVGMLSYFLSFRRI